jgi:hypothetical protein
VSYHVQLARITGCPLINIKAKDLKGKIAVESKIEGKTEKRISRKHLKRYG